MAWSSSWVASLDLGTAFEPTPRTLAESLSSPVSIPRTAAPASRSEPALNPLPPVSTQSRRCLPQLSQGRARAVRGGRPPLLRQIISTCYARCARVRGLGRCACSCERVRFGGTEAAVHASARCTQLLCFPGPDPIPWGFRPPERLFMLYGHRSGQKCAKDRLHPT